MRAWLKSRVDREHRGQSLVEVALFLPILIFIIAGLVEVSNLLVTQNRVTTSSRVSAGFGAANYDPNQWDRGDGTGLAFSMGNVAINTVTETLDLDANLWDVWAVRAEFNDAGTDFEVFSTTHVYGSNVVISSADWTTTREPALRAEMLSDLLEGDAPTQDLAVVATVDFHNLDTILGLPVWQWVGLKTVRGITVMRVDKPPAYAGCPILPIAIRLDQYSIYPSNWIQGARLYPDLDPVSLFPAQDDPWDYPNGKQGNPDPPIYLTETPWLSQTISTTTFVSNAPGVPLVDAQSGYLYWARDISEEGNFAWLTWRNGPGGTSVTRLDASLDPATYGNFYDPVYGYPGSESDLGTGGDYPGTGSGDGDGVLEIEEWIGNSTGYQTQPLFDHLQFYVDTGRPIFLIVFDYDDGETGENLDFHVADFAKVRLIGWGGTSSKWILFEFIAWGIECYGPDDQL